MSDKFLENLSRASTWSIAADFNHIAHPLGDPTDGQKNHKDPSFWDRFGGSVLLILMTPLIVPVCLYLFWASKKVELIDEFDEQDAAARTDQFAQDSPAFRHIKAKNEDAGEVEGVKETIAAHVTQVIQPAKSQEKEAIEAIEGHPAFQKQALPLGSAVEERVSAREDSPDHKTLLTGALVAFGPHRNKAAAQKACKTLEESALFTPEIRSFLLEEAIANDQIDKVALLLAKPKKAEGGEEKKTEEKPGEASSFNLSTPIPLHKANSVAMVQKLVALGVKTNVYVDENNNTPLHLVSNGAVAQELLKQALKEDGGETLTYKENADGNTPFHTCQNLGVYLALTKVHSTNGPKANTHGESPLVTLLTRLESLVSVRDSAKSKEDWEVLDKQVKSLEKVAKKMITDKRGSSISSPNRVGYNALHLCAKMGNHSLLNDVQKLNYPPLDPHRNRMFDTVEMRERPTPSLYANSVATVDGSSYTCCDLAIVRLQILKERLENEQDAEMVNKLTNEIIEVRRIIIDTSDSLRGPRGENHYPLHCLVELGEVEVLKKMKLGRDLEVEANKKNEKGETPWILALKKMHEVSQMRSSPENSDSERERLEAEFTAQREIVEFFLKFESQEKAWSVKLAKNVPKSVAFLKLRDDEGNSALHLCIGIGDPTLVKQLVDHPNFDPKSLAPEEGDGPLSTALKYRQGDVETLKQFKEMEESEKSQAASPAPVESAEVKPEIQAAQAASPAPVESAEAKPETQSAQPSPPEEPSKLKQMLQPRIEAQEKIVLILLSKAIESVDPELLESLLTNIPAEIHLGSLKFLKKTPLLKIAFDQIEKIRENVAGSMKAHSNNPEIRANLPIFLNRQIEQQKRLIKVLIAHGLTKGNKEYHPLFDALKLKDLALVEQLVASEHVDVNALQPTGLKATPLYIAFNELNDLKRLHRFRLSQIPNAPDQPEITLESYKRDKIKKELAELEVKIEIQEKMIEAIDSKNPKAHGSLLHACAEVGDYYILKKLLSDREINVDGLRTDGRKEFTPLLRALIALGDYEKIEPKTEAVNTEIVNLESVVRILLDNQADILVTLRLQPDLAGLHFRVGKLDPNASDANGKVPLQRALSHLKMLGVKKKEMEAAHLDQIAVAIQATRPINTEKKLIKLLLEKGADVSVELDAEERALLDSLRAEK